MTNVTFSLVNCLSNNFYSKVFVTPMNSPIVYSGSIIVGDTINFLLTTQNPTNTLSLVPNSYLVRAIGQYVNNEFYIIVPELNGGSINASSIITGSVPVNTLLTMSFAVSSAYANTSSYVIGGGLTIGATYSITSSWANKVISASYAPSSYILPSSITASFSGSLTGVLIGTASWSSNSLTASYITSSNVFGTVTSSSYSLSSSYAPTIIPSSITASFSGSLVGTSSWSTNALTASLLLGSAVTSSYALTASYASNGGSGGTSLTTGSTYPITSSWANNTVSSSYSISASYALGSNGVTGGTTNYIPLWNGSTTITSSNIYYSGSTLGINQIITSSYIVDTLSSASLGGLRITINNSNSNLATSSIAGIVLKNTNGSLQSHLTFTNNTDQVMGGIMSDFQGNFKWFAKGSQAHQFYTTIAATDTNTKAISNNGFYFDNQGHNGNVGTYPFHIKNTAVDKWWVDINGNIFLQGQLINSSNFIGANANIVGTGAGTFGGGNVFSAAQVTNCNMFGYQACSQVNYSLAGTNTYTGSNFFGYQAGAALQSANYNYSANSNFIGYQAGATPSSAGTSTTTHYSNFFGYQAGYGAQSACNSIFIGKQAGYLDTVNNGANNTPNGNSSIAIGDYSAPKGFANSITIGRATGNSATAQANIGNVLWINGIQSTGTTSVNVAISSSKVGIGTNTPNSSLQVIGNVSASNYTASATGIGFLGTSSWANNSLSSSYSLTASYAPNTYVLPSTITASFSGSLTGSVLGSASYATTSSYILSASYAPTILPSSYTSSFSGSLTGSVYGTSSWSVNSVTSSYNLNSISSSFAATASVIPNKQQFGAWAVAWDGSPMLSQSYNITSISKSAVGSYYVTMSRALTPPYSVTFSGYSGSGAILTGSIASIYNTLASSFSMSVSNNGNTALANFSTASLHIVSF